MGYPWCTFPNELVGLAHEPLCPHQTDRLCSHPHRSDASNEFTVVHNGIITNYKEMRMVLEKKGYSFVSDTDTEVAVVLAKYLYDSQKGKPITFTALIKSVVKELEGAFAFVFKSVHYPDELVVCRRGSPVLIGVKTEKKLKVDFVDVEVPATDAAPSNDKDARERTILCAAHRPRSPYRLSPQYRHPRLVRGCFPCPDTVKVIMRLWSGANREPF